MKRLVNEAALPTTMAVHEAIEHLLPEGDRRAAFDAIYARIALGMEALLLRAEQERRRLHPGKE